MIINPEITYHVHLAQLLKTRLKGLDEMACLDKLEEVWETLSPDSITRIRAVSRRFTGNQNAEQQYLDWFNKEFLSFLMKTNVAEGASSEPSVMPRDMSATTLSACVA